MALLPLLAGSRRAQHYCHDHGIPQQRAPRRTGRTPTDRSSATHLTGTRVTALARAARRRWREHRDALVPVGPDAAGPWAAADRPDRDRIRMLAELRAAPRTPSG